MPPVETRIESITPKYGWRACESCGHAVPLRTQRDLRRKRFCSRPCIGAYIIKLHGEKIRTAGKTDESLAKRSQSMKEYWVKHRNPGIGRFVTAEERERISRTQKRRLAANPSLIHRGPNHHAWKGGREHKRAMRRMRYANCPSFRIGVLLRNRINRALKGAYRAGSHIRDLGCTAEELVSYLESLFQDGMTWDNHGTWHIDHKKPLALFDLSNRVEFIRAAHYTNLQPLWASDNCRKGRQEACYSV